MSFPLNEILVQLFRPTADLPTPIARSLDAWRALPPPADDTLLAQARLVVVGVETSGFDARRNRLLALGAVAIENLRAMSTGTFSAVLRPGAPDDAAVLDDGSRHGVTPDRQGAGTAPEEALSEFLTFAGKSPCVAFHAAFVQTVLDRALRVALGVHTLSAWLDLTQLAPRLVPQAQPDCTGVDDWLRHFGLHVLVRDHAVHDAQVTAELFLILLQRALERGIDTLGALRAVARIPEGIATGSGVSGP